MMKRFQVYVGVTSRICESALRNKMADHYFMELLLSIEIYLQNHREQKQARFSYFYFFSIREFTNSPLSILCDVKILEIINKQCMFYTFCFQYPFSQCFFSY